VIIACWTKLHTNFGFSQWWLWRLPSFGMCRHVDWWIGTSVLEEPTASRVQGVYKLLILIYTMPHGVTSQKMSVLAVVQNWRHTTWAAYNSVYLQPFLPKFPLGSGRSTCSTDGCGHVPHPSTVAPQARADPQPCISGTSFLSLESLPVVSVSHFCIHVCWLVLYCKSLISDFLWLRL
jgi:hypothetical protein